MNLHKENIINTALSMKFGGMQEQELRFLYDFCIDKTVLELGSMVGMSSYTIASVAKEIHCVDAWDDSFNHIIHDYEQTEAYKTTYLSMFSTPPNMLNIFKENCKKFLDSGKIKMVQGKTTEVVDFFKKNFYDVLFIDADHSEEGVRSDIKNYIHVLKENGFVIFHDYNTQIWPGVTKAAKEIEHAGLIKHVETVASTGVFQLIKKDII